MSDWIIEGKQIEQNKEPFPHEVRIPPSWIVKIRNGLIDVSNVSYLSNIGFRKIKAPGKTVGGVIEQDVWIFDVIIQGQIINCAYTDKTQAEMEWKGLMEFYCHYGMFEAAIDRWHGIQSVPVNEAPPTLPGDEWKNGSPA